MATKYDSSGRQQVSAPWDGITDMPEIIDEIAALADPGAGLWVVGWNDTSGAAEWVNIPNFAGAGADGLVPDPVTEAGKFLKDDGTWGNEATFAGAGAAGLVPNPVTESGRYLEDDGTWSTPPFPAVFFGAGDDGLVPDPGLENGYFLRDDGAWVSVLTASTQVAAGIVGGSGVERALPSGWSCSLTGTVYRVTHSLGLSDANYNGVVCTAHTGAAHASAQVSDRNANYFEVVIFDDENNQVTGIDWGFVFINLGALV